MQSSESTGISVKETAKVVKYDGPAPNLGEDKQPFEIVEGDYDRKTDEILNLKVLFRRPGADPSSYSPVDDRPVIGDDYHSLLPKDHENYRPPTSGESHAKDQS